MHFPHIHNSMYAELRLLFTTRVFLFGQTCTFSGYTFTRFWSESVEILHLPFGQQQHHHHHHQKGSVTTTKKLQSSAAQDSEQKRRTLHKNSSKGTTPSESSHITPKKCLHAPSISCFYPKHHIFWKDTADTLHSISQSLMIRRLATQKVSLHTNKSIIMAWPKSND